MTDWYSLPGFNQPVSSLSHLSGAVVFAIVGSFLLRPLWRDRTRFWCVAIFATASVALLSLSGVYHMFAPDGTVGQVMVRLDIAAVFFLIAASFTPIHGIMFRGWKRWGVLIPIWLFALAGATLRIVFFEQVSRMMGVGIFLGMGWVGAVSGYLLWRVAGWRAMVPVVGGGVLYSLGALAHALRWPTIIPWVWGPHETFHFAVLGGLSWHWQAISHIANGTYLRPPAAQASNL